MELLDFCYEIIGMIEPFLIGLLGIAIARTTIRIILNACKENWITEADEIEKNESENIDDELKRYFNYKEEK